MKKSNKEVIGIIRDFIINRQDHNKYAEILFIYGILNLKEFERNSEVKNEYAIEARDAFACAHNAFKIQHGKGSNQYLEAISYTSKVYSSRNIPY